MAYHQMIVILSLVLIVLAAVFYFGSVATAAALPLLIVGVALLAVSILAR